MPTGQGPGDSEERDWLGCLPDSLCGLSPDCPGCRVKECQEGQGQSAPLGDLWVDPCTCDLSSGKETSCP